MRLLEEDSDRNEKLYKTSFPGKMANRLIREKSPYLLQHAYNPVDWYPWGEEAFEKARLEDKPIFLSIGYSTCYWCHVMEREVFENLTIAEMLNRMFISIKVDREERPDIDRIYMTALQSLTGSGGWPISIFMTAEGKPFFAATYIPPENRNGNPGFDEILNRMHEIWLNERDKVTESSNYVHQLLINISSPVENDLREPVKEMIEICFKEFKNTYDKLYGGFSTAPKFPQPVVLNFLFRYFYRTGNKEALDMALTTLRKISEGGIYDHIGGGFHRYSTDGRWLIPHFEKMLYDQAQMVVTCLEAFQITHDDQYKQTAYETLKYINKVMSNPEGGFFTAVDAESGISHFYPEQKKEGAFYTWKKDDIRNSLSVDEFKIAEYIFDIKEEGNMTPDIRREFTGVNILHKFHSIEETAEYFKSTKETIESNLKIIKSKLLDVRRQRPRPDIDDKILLGWNGLMISAFARAFQVFRDQSYIETAVNAVRFIYAQLYNQGTGKLLRRYRDGEAKYDACLSDYAFLIQALLDLYEASFEIEWLKKAVQLTEEQIQLFYDNENGGFFENSDRNAPVKIRLKNFIDNSEPSGNSVSILNMLRLSKILGSARLNEIALKSIACFNKYIWEFPQSLPQLLIAVDFFLSKPVQIILAGNKNHPLMREMVDEINSRFIPDKVLIHADNNEGQKYLNKFISLFNNFSSTAGKQTAYICHDYVCESPVSNINDMTDLLDKLTKA